MVRDADAHEAQNFLIIVGECRPILPEDHISAVEIVSEIKKTLRKRLYVFVTPTHSSPSKPGK
jgi:hypothetical protein